MKKVLLLYSLLQCIIFASLAQGSEVNLKSLTVKGRNEHLINTAKKTVIHYNKEFYRQHGKPKIDSYEITEGDHRGRRVYTVTFYYDKQIEQMPLNFASKVYIWENTGKPFSIHYGNTMGQNIE
ncbi:hypothetical protein WG947_00850 [Pontibacter sp. H259]|uniref:hypothetical protein n=1 Tax=Pontibacter sp. H259 TaxID=3133421 RepID=UPI0030BA4102